jgi:hypothetical protein
MLAISRHFLIFKYLSHQSPNELSTSTISAFRVIVASMFCFFLELSNSVNFGGKLPPAWEKAADISLLNLVHSVDVD